MYCLFLQNTDLTILRNILLSRTALTIYCLSVLDTVDIILFVKCIMVVVLYIALIRRARRCGYYDSDLPPFDELCDNADKQLFDNVRRNSHHTLHHLLPPESLASQNYSLSSHAHNRQLPEHFNHLDDSNFIIRMLYKNMY